MRLDHFLLELLTEESNAFAFDCGDDDINDFFRNDALKNQNNRKVATYVFTERNTKSVVAFFSISNSSVPDAGDRMLLNKHSRWISTPRNWQFSPKILWNNLRQKRSIKQTPWFAFDTREKAYPAILIARLGVDKKYQRKKIGTQLLDFIKGWVEIDNKSAFRLLILDAYNRESHMNYYSKNGFITLLEEDKNKYTRLLYFDMVRLSDN